LGAVDFRGTIHNPEDAIFQGELIKVKLDRVNKRLIATALTLVSAVAGCMASTRLDPVVDWVVADEYRIAVASEILESAKPIRVKYTDAWQTEEYALFRADGRQCEIIYAEANRAFTVALDYRMPIEEMVATWNLNSQPNLVWGPLGRIDRRFGTWFYRTYEHGDPQRSCAGFMAEWDQIYEDPQGRPGKVVFGYFCGAGGETLEDQEVRALIRGISVRMQGESSGEQKTEYLHEAGSIKPSAIAAAKGYGPAADSGNPGFPFRFARYYSLSNGGKFK
jgi:hypothetical protein